MAKTVTRRSLVCAAVTLACLLNLAESASARTNLSDDQVRQRLIEESIRSYPGNCPCPYNLARNGSRCGARSAYSRPGGASPLCYPKDVTDDMVRSWRRRQGE